MPLPNDKSRLAHRLAKATGCSMVWVYRLLKTGRSPYGKKAATAWARVVAREERRRLVAEGGDASACPESAAATAAKGQR